MAIYAMSDLHIALDNPEKTMEVFGPSWENYIERIKEGCKDIGKDDIFLMPGDLSWITYLEQSTKDFEFINNLPGHKYIVRGNHDYWWGTAKKMQEQMKAKGYDTITILRNNAVVCDEAVISGTRGWKRSGVDDMTADDLKIEAREIARIKLCLKAIEEADPNHTKPHIFMLHYPPLSKNFGRTNYSDLIEGSGIVDICLYGHLHGRVANQIFEGEKNAVRYFCVAADYRKYRPLRVL